ncbi:hypothetical protein D9M69_610410 [compost metagenome]
METLYFKFVVALFKITSCHTLFKIFKLLDLLTHSVNVRKHTANPTLCDKRLVNADCSRLHEFFCLLFCTNEKYLLATSCHLSDNRKCLFKSFNSFRQIDDVTILTLRVNVWRHFRVPTARFVSKVDTSFEQSFNIYSYCHKVRTPLFLTRIPEGFRSYDTDCVVK